MSETDFKTKLLDDPDLLGSKLLLGDLQVLSSSSKLAKRIAVIGMTLLDRAPNPLMKALAQVMESKHDWKIVFMSEAYIDAFRLPEKMECDGILARVVSKEIAAIARRLSCPIVNFSSLLENSGVSTVRRDDKGMGTICAEHLLEKGFTRFGVIEMPYRDWCYSRTRAGFLEGISAESPGSFISHFPLDEIPPGHDSLKRFKVWVQSLEKPFALFICDDRPAQSLMNACGELGLRIPQDVAVISGCAHPEIVCSCKPSLTHPREDAEWLMSPACELLSKLMENRKIETTVIEIPNPGLVLGDSTNTIALDDPLVAEAVDFIHENVHKGINVADIVSHLKCSRRHLEMKFINRMKTTPRAYLTERRIVLAKTLLTAPAKQTLPKISRTCGFSNWKVLSRVFKAETGQSPAEWRKLHLISCSQ